MKPQFTPEQWASAEKISAQWHEEFAKLQPLINKIVWSEEMCNQISAFVKQPGNEVLNAEYEESKRAILNDSIEPNPEIDRSFVVRRMLTILFLIKRDRASFDKIVDHLAQN